MGKEDQLIKAKISQKFARIKKEEKRRGGLLIYQVLMKKMCYFYQMMLIWWNRWAPSSLLNLFSNQSSCEPLNLENKLWKGVIRHCSLRNYLWRESRLAFEQAHKASFHSGVCCDICKMKQFNVKKLFVTQAYLHVLRYIYLYMSSWCCSQNRKIILFGQKWCIDSE